MRVNEVMDRLFKGLMFDGDISVSILETTRMVNVAIEYHHLSPVCAAALGRAMIATTFMASGLKNEDDRLSVTISGNGLGGTIVVCGDRNLNMRGYIDNPQVDIPLNSANKLDVRGCVGNKGRITVVKSMGLKEPYTGTCHIISGEIAEDFAAYYTYSEQIPTAMALGVKIGKDMRCVGAGGVIFQVMPGAREESIAAAEELIGKFSAVSGMIEDIKAEGIIDKFFKTVEFTEYSTQYKCNCSKEYVDKMLLTLGAKELYDTIDKIGKVEVDCHFCPQKYVYFKEDVDELLKDGTSDQGTTE